MKSKKAALIALGSLVAIAVFMIFIRTGERDMGEHTESNGHAAMESVENGGSVATQPIDGNDSTLGEYSVGYSREDAEGGDSAVASTPTTALAPSLPVGDYSIYVCTTGSDQNSGIREYPFATVQRAVFEADRNRNRGNQTIYLREGIYFQQFMIANSYYDPHGRNRPDGDEPAFLTIRNYPGEVAVLDGSRNIVVDQGQHQMIIIQNSDYVRIYGLVIQNNAPTNSGFATPAAVMVETVGTMGRSQGVEIINNTILGMDGDTFGHPTASAPGANGSAIQVYGRTQFEENALRYVLIEGNEIAYGRVGWTENIVVAGNVSDFAVRSNFVHNNNNIGINVIGLWGWVTNTGTSAAARSDWNRARRGVVEGNVVINNIGYGNHAYESCGGASGIYVDGAMDITIRYNFVSGSSAGISVGTEPPHARWYGPEPVMAENIRMYHNILANNRQGAVLLGGTFGAWDLDVYYNTMIGRDIVRGSAGGVNGVVNINNNWSGSEMNRNFFFGNNILVSFVDADVNLADPNHLIRYLSSGWNDNDAGASRTAYLTFEGNVLYGRVIGGITAENALPHTNLLEGNVRVTTSPLAGMNFAAGTDTGDFTLTTSANGAGACIQRIQEAMEGARLPLFEIAMADYRAFVNVLPAATDIVRHLSQPAVRGSIDQPLTLEQVGRNIARYFEGQVAYMPVTNAVPADSLQRHNVIVGILHWAYGYDPEPTSGYGGRLSVQSGFHTDNAYRGIISFGFGNEGDVDFARIAALDSPWTLGSVRGTPHQDSRYPGIRFFVRIPYFNPVSGRTSYIVRGFSTPHWWRGLNEAAAVLAITMDDIINARRDNPMRRYVCAETGCDTHDGSITHPWATINHGLQQIWHGDTLFLRGTFYENVTIPVSASGNINNPTTLTNWPGHGAVIDGMGGEFAIYMPGVDNFTISDIELQNATHGIFAGTSENTLIARRTLRNFQSNWWDLHCLNFDNQHTDSIYGLGMMRDINITNVTISSQGEEVVIGNAPPHSLHLIRV